MPTAKFNIKYLTSLTRLKISGKKLQEQISKLGLEIGEVTNEDISIELNLSRPDLLDPVGLARAIRYFVHKSSKYTYNFGNENPEMSISVSDNIKDIRPFIAGMVVKGIKFDDVSLAQLMSFIDKFCDTFGRKRKKIAVGIHNLDSIESRELLYFLADDEKFIPLNSKNQENFSHIIKTNKKGIAYGETIDNGERGYPVLKDKKGVLAVIPIINSDRTRVIESTKSLFVDVTGSSEYAIEKSMDMLAAMFLDMGAKIYPVITSYGGSKKIYPVMKSKYIFVDLEEIEKSLGVRFDYVAAISLANKMGYEAALVGKKIRFRVPEYRLDVINEQDIIEDMAIAYGYDYIQPVGLPSYNAGSLESTTLKNRNMESVMTGIGFTQVMNSYLTNPYANYEKMEVKRAREEAVTIANSVNSSISMLRTWLLPSLMGNLSRSQHEKMPHRLFELDMAFMEKHFNLESDEADFIKERGKNQ